MGAGLAVVAGVECVLVRLICETLDRGVVGIFAIMHTFTVLFMSSMNLD